MQPKNRDTFCQEDSQETRTGSLSGDILSGGNIQETLVTSQFLSGDTRERDRLSRWDQAGHVRLREGDRTRASGNTDPSRSLVCLFTALG